MRVERARRRVFVHVCKNSQEEPQGRDLQEERSSAAKKRKGAFQAKPQFFDFPDFWLNNPGTYYWQAHRIACDGSSTTACRKARSSASR